MIPYRFYALLILIYLTCAFTYGALDPDAHETCQYGVGCEREK